MSRKLMTRLWPVRLREKPELKENELADLFANVSDNDPCLKGTHELLSRMLQANFVNAGSLSLADGQRLECARNAYLAYWLMGEIERYRALGRERRELGLP